MQRGAVCATRRGGNTYGEGLNVHDSWLRVYDSQDSQARISGQKLSKRFDKKADKIMEFFLKAGNMGHNRGSWLMVNDLWLGRQYVARKAFSMFRRIGDLINHARIFPQDSLRFSFTIMKNGLVSAVRGE